MTDEPKQAVLEPVVTLELVEPHIALATISRPNKLNALNRQVLEELTSLVGGLDASVRVLIVTGAGEKAFAAGADIAAMASLNSIEAKALADLGHRLGALLESSKFVTIAMVSGFALGGGCELAMACDLIYAAESAKFGQPEVNLGVIPGFGGTQRLVRRVGVGKARELIYTGDVVGAQEALRIGLCEGVFPTENLRASVLAQAKKIAGKGPLAIQAAKVVMRTADVTLSPGNELEAQAFAVLFGSSDQKEGMAAFVGKRPANFEGK